MADHTRFGVYVVPRGDCFAAFGARWLGWDVVAGKSCPQPDIPDLDDITMTPRKYGFHATLKPPFRLKEGCSPESLDAALSELAAVLPAVETGGLCLARLESFLAFVPIGSCAGLNALASRLVQDLDVFRAAATVAELEKRRKAGLTPGQHAYLQAWGYPYVLDEFRFHLTLSVRLSDRKAAQLEAAIAQQAPPLPVPFRVKEIALVGERAQDGMFEVLQFYTLNG